MADEKKDSEEKTSDKEDSESKEGKKYTGGAIPKATKAAKEALTEE